MYDRWMENVLFLFEEKVYFILFIWFMFREKLNIQEQYYF